VNNKLRDVELIGLGRIEAPEDVILDRDDHLYAGSRHGDIIRFLAPDYQQMEVFAHIGGQPWAWPSTATGTCWSAWAAWACTGDAAARGAVRDRRDQPQLGLDQRRQPTAPGR
jgi:hypothetical protein